MCLILFAYRCHPEYPLILAANRDEFFARPTRSAQFWPENSELLAGQDLDHKGTWLGLSTRGRLAAVTNFREGKNRQASLRSRGSLTTEFLTSELTPADYLDSLSQECQQFNGFNLLVGDIHSLWYYSNRERQPHHLQPGLYGLSNHLLNTPWPKVESGKRQLAQLIAAAQADTQPASIADHLIQLMGDDTQAEDHHLPATGLPLEWERTLSPIFIAADDYGTRASSVVLINNSGETFFREIAYDNQQTVKTSTEFSFLMNDN